MRCARLDTREDIFCRASKSLCPAAHLMGTLNDIIHGSFLEEHYAILYIICQVKIAIGRLFFTIKDKNREKMLGWGPGAMPSPYPAP